MVYFEIDDIFGRMLNILREWGRKRERKRERDGNILYEKDKE